MSDVPFSVFMRSVVSFPGPGESAVGAGDNLDYDAIMKYWGIGTGGVPPEKVECEGACKIIMVRALIDVIGKGTFNALYTSSTVPMRAHDVPISQMSKGDWGWLLNDPRYQDRPVDYGFAGENIIKLGNDSYFGFPVGPQSEAAWTQTLIDAFNEDLQPGETKITALPPGSGWQSDHNTFLDVAEIAMNVFDNRNK